MFLNTEPYYVNHTSNRIKDNKDKIRLAAIDPGIRNTSVYIEERSEKKTRLQEFRLFDFKTSADKTVYESSTELLNEILPELELCDVILVESQMTRNPIAMRLMQHLISFLILKTTNPQIIEISPKFKTGAFNAPRMKSKDAKKWAIVKATQLIEERKDKLACKVLDKLKKKDDFSDTLCYCEAWVLSKNK